MSDCDCFDCKVLPYKRPDQAVADVVDALNRRDLPARLYNVERAALHFLDVAMRIRREAELDVPTGATRDDLENMLAEHLDACAVAVMGLRKVD